MRIVEMTVASVAFLLGAGWVGERWNRRIHGTTPPKNYREIKWNRSR